MTLAFFFLSPFCLSLSFSLLMIFYVFMQSFNCDFLGRWRCKLRPIKSRRADHDYPTSQPVFDLDLDLARLQSGDVNHATKILIAVTISQESFMLPLIVRDTWLSHRVAFLLLSLSLSLSCSLKFLTLATRSFFSTVRVSQHSFHSLLARNARVPSTHAAT